MQHADTQSSQPLKTEQFLLEHNEINEEQCYGKLADEFSSLVKIKNLYFKRQAKVIFDGVDICIPKGKVTAIMGPSGTGKTTLLKIIGGQLKPDAGNVWYQSQNVHTLNRVQLFELRSKMGMLFQSGALFGDLTVFENVAFPINAHLKLSEKEVADIVNRKLQQVGLKNTQDLMPDELSGGMKRRVALARAIALNPELIMYDEPFAGQDPIVMATLVKLIRSLSQQLGLTSIIVSHDIHETLSIADWVYLIADGKVQAKGTPAQIKANPCAFVQQFVHGQIDDDLA